MKQAQYNILIAHAASEPWAIGLAGSLGDLPVNLHWSRTEAEAVGLASRQRLHLGVVDEAVPDAGGLSLVRRMRRLGMEVPLFLVTQESNQRLLRDALELQVISVILAAAYRETLLPAVFRTMRRRYNFGDGVPNLEN